MSALGTLVRWDWFKLARRWMPWVLLIILLLLSQLGVWGNYFRFRNIEHTGGTVTIGAGRGGTEVSCSAILSGNIAALPPGTTPQVLEGLKAQCQQEAAGNQARLKTLYNGFTLPGSIPEALGVGLSLGLVLLAVLTASVFGAEYGWGTVRTTLVRGTGRSPYLAAKLLLLALLAAAALLVVVAGTAVSSTIADRLVTAPAGVTATSWSHALALLGRTWVALLPYIAFTALVTVLTHSSAIGMAIGIGYYLAEQIIVGILSGIFSWFHDIADFLLAQNITTFAGVPGGSALSVSVLHAFLVLLVYAVVLGALAFYVFHERDVTGSSTG